jgi:hypothetical protein
MNHLFCVFGFMAHGAQSVALLNKRDLKITGVFPGLHVRNNLVTCRTRPVLDRAMHSLVFAHGCVAFGGDTGIGLCSSSAGDDEHHSKDQEYISSDLLHHGLTP